MQKQKEIEGNFFEGINNKLIALSQNISIWKKSDPKQLEVVKDMIGLEENEYNLLLAQVKDIKLYIVVMGTISAGKSTFFNALLGGQLLPYRNEECTTQMMEITYDDRISINGEIFDDIYKARDKLEEFQNEKEQKKIEIKFPSLFHKDFQADLRSRIILVDTPGIQLKKNYKKNPYERLDQILGKNLFINVWISNFTTFSSDKKKIFSFLENQKIEQTIHQENLEKKQNIEGQQVEQKCHDKLLFLLNKYDQREAGNDAPIEPIINQICEKLKDKNFIYKISSKWALEYRIMTLGDQMSQNLFVDKYFQANKIQNEYKDIEQCKADCEKKIKDNRKYIDNQDFPILLEQLKSQIELKITNELFGARLSKIIAIDYYLQIFLSFAFQIQQTDKLKASVAGFIKSTHKVLINYEEDLKKIQNTYLDETQKLIEITQQSISDLNFFQKIFSGNKSVLQNLCEEILQKEKILGEQIEDLNKRIQQVVMIKIKDIEQSNELIEELSTTCKKLFLQYRDIQNQCIQQSQFQSLKENFYNILGIDLTMHVQTKVGLASTLIGSFVLGGDLYLTLAAATFFTPIGLFSASGLIGSGIVLMVTQKVSIEKKFCNVHSVTQNLNVKCNNILAFKRGLNNQDKSSLPQFLQQQQVNHQVFEKYIREIGPMSINNKKLQK